MQPEKTRIMQIDEAELEEAEAQLQREGYTALPGLTGLALKVMCKRHDAMYAGCNQEHVKLTIISTFMERAAKACEEETDESGVPTEFAAFLKRFAAEGEHMCCMFPDDMHAELVTRSKKPH